MTISNPHNISQPATAIPDGAFGVRVSLPSGDPLAYLLDDNWTMTHWFASSADRDAALREMARLHEYSRPFDKPALVFEAIDRGAND